MPNKETEILSRYKERVRKQNEKAKENYDRVTALLPKGTIERIKSLGLSINRAINESLIAYLECLEEDIDSPDSPQKPSQEPQEESLDNSLTTDEALLQGQELTVEMVQAMLDANRAEQANKSDELRHIHAAAEEERLAKMRNPEYAATFAEMDKIAMEEKERKRAETLTMARIQSNQY